MSDKSLGRKVVPSLLFSGKKVDHVLKDYLERVTYTDVASGSSDELSIDIHNVDNKWVNGWFPKKGNTIGGSLTFQNWNNDGRDPKLACGTFTLDDIKFNFGPKTASFSGVSAPAKESFKVRDRHKTWKKITIRGIAKEICKRYKLKLLYKAATIQIKELEQSENDCQFLTKLCEDYGLAMKIYRRKIVIYGQNAMERRKAVATLNLAQFEGSDLSITDSIYGTYTGAKMSYKSAKSDKEISVYVGLKKEKAKGSRVLRINETCDSAGEAKKKAAAKVNASNRKATVLTGTIFPNPKICAGSCINLGADFGKLKGKYFIDKVSWDIGSSGTTQKIDAHKVMKKVRAK